jgi:hypothetical protein
MWKLVETDDATGLTDDELISIGVALSASAMPHEDDIYYRAWRKIRRATCTAMIRSTGDEDLRSLLD